MQMENIRPNQDMGAPQPWGPPQNFPMNAGGGHGFRPNQFMPPQHQFDNFYPRVDMAPPMDKPGLYENFIADAATADAQNQAAPPPSSQGYNPYPGQVPSYPAQPAPPGHAHAAGDYSNPVYGGNYGY